LPKTPKTVKLKATTLLLKVIMPTKTDTILIVILFTVALTICNVNAPTQAQTAPIEFTPTDNFPIPEQNATINFAFNGTFTSATLQNGTWTFRKLQISHPQTALGLDLTDAQPVGDLKFSAKDCNVTIWAYLTFYYTLPVNSLMYYVNGLGTQTVNLGLNYTRSDPSEWSIITGDNVFLAAEQGWKLLPDNTLIMQDISGNVTIAHFQLDAFTGSAVFALQHFVSILTGMVLGAVVVVAVVIKIRAKRRLKN
jgi:hypothetical protein